MKLLPLLAVAGTFLCTSLSALCQMTPEMRSADPRMQRTLTIQNPRIKLADLLKEVSKQSGVPISGSLGEDANTELAISVKGMRTGEFLDCLWSALSFEKAAWLWKQIGTGAAAAYQFVAPTNARAPFSAWQEEQENRSAAELESLIRVALAGRELGKAEQDRHNRTFSPKVDFDKVTSVQWWEGLRALADITTPQQRKQWLREQGSIWMDVRTAPATVRELALNSALDRRVVGSIDNTIDPNESLGVEYSANRSQGSLTPCLRLGTGNSPPSSAMPFSRNGLPRQPMVLLCGEQAETGVRLKWLERWTHVGDMLSDPASSKSVLSTAGNYFDTVKEESNPFGSNRRMIIDVSGRLRHVYPIEDVLVEACRSATVPVIIVRSAKSGYLSINTGERIAELVNRSRGLGSLCKWRHGVLLTGSTGVIRDVLARIPTAVAKTKITTPEQLASIAASLTPDQRETLMSVQPHLTSARAWMPLLAGLGRTNRLREAQNVTGTLVDDDLRLSAFLTATKLGVPSDRIMRTRWIRLQAMKPQSAKIPATWWFSASSVPGTLPLWKQGFAVLTPGSEAKKAAQSGP